MKHEFSAPDGLGEMHTINIIPRTMLLITQARIKGAVIRINANWRYTGRREGFKRVIKLSQTNSKRHGKPEHIVWACYPEGK